MTLSDYILQDLRGRLTSRGRTPEALTLTSLAELYSVSLTPVRYAVNALLNEGILIKHDNGRLDVSQEIPKRNARKQHEPVAPPRNWEAAVLREILLQSLHPQVEFLREEAFAEQLGMGRTLLRTILGRLAGGGLLEHVPRCGWKIRPFREEDLNAYLEIRELLEMKALDLARPHLEPQILQAMLEGNTGAEGRIDNRLHEYFIQRSENRYLQDFFATSGRFYSMLFDYAALGESVIARMAQQHREILQHALNRKWGEAKRALTSHIRAQKPIVLKLIERLREQQTTKASTETC